MAIRNGITPRRLRIPLTNRYVRYTDHRDLDLHRTFGATAAPLAPLKYNYDAGIDMPDQNADGLPEACTGYTQKEVAQDADKQEYSARYTYDKTLEMQGLPAGSPCDIRTSMKSTMVYGVQKPSETTDTQAEQHRQGPFFNINRMAGMDWFDSIRLALRNNPKCSASVGTPWFAEFHTVGPDGILSSIFIGDPNMMPWHNHKMSGETNVNGIPYLLDKSWQGPNIGRGGWLLWSRELVNAVMDISGTEAFLRRPVGSASVQTIELTIWETILSYIGMYLAKLSRAKIQPMDTPQPPAVTAQQPVVAVNTPKGSPELLQRFCLAIQLYEGYIAPGGKDGAGNVYPAGSPAWRNKNPGNLRCLKGDNANWNVLATGCDNNFCTFPDYDTGMKALENVTRAQARGQSTLYNNAARKDFNLGDASEMNLYQYFETRDPSSDGNYPAKFAEFMASQLGVDIKTFKLRDLVA